MDHLGTMGAHTCAKVGDTCSYSPDIVHLTQKCALSKWSTYARLYPSLASPDAPHSVPVGLACHPHFVSLAWAQQSPVSFLGIMVIGVNNSSANLWGINNSGAYISGDDSSGISFFGLSDTRTKVDSFGNWTWAGLGSWPLLNTHHPWHHDIVLGRMKIHLCTMFIDWIGPYSPSGGYQIPVYSFKHCDERLPNRESYTYFVGVYCWMLAIYDDIDLLRCDQDVT